MRSWKFVLPLLASSLCFAVQSDRITSPIDSSQMVALKGSVHGLAQARFDLGRTDNSQVIHGVTLVFHPSAAQQADLDNLLAQQQDRSSPNYHQWLTPAQFADRFGMTQDDINQAVSWLESQGFTVTSVANSRNQISFDGTVAQIESVFATEIHNYLVDGETHFANATNPSVPAALAASVLAVGHLHNFGPKPRAIVKKVSAEATDPHFTSSVSGSHFVAPGDFATIYDVGPLYTAGIDGTGQSIAIVGQSTVNAADLANFRSAAGLAAKVPQYVLVPSTAKATRCPGDEGESDLDIEWSGAVARNANIIFVYAGLVGSDTCTSRVNSVWEALQTAVDNNVAPVISTSYGFCESGLGLSFTNTLRGWAQQANSQGQTIMSSSGDDGAADCDFQVTSATQGLAVDAPASIPEVTGMGGSEFTGDAEGTASNGNVAATQYWAGTTGSDAISSALSYIPEEAWNDTTLNLTQQGGTIGASGGGASIYFTKATGEASWQTGVGVPNDNKRDVPDLSMNASPDHDGYLFCSEDGAKGALQTTCSSGFRDGSGGTLAVVGGTSAAAPTFSAITALLNQYLITKGFVTKAGLGNINPNLYYIAAGNPTALHDITAGNNIVPCTAGTANCPTTAPFQYGFTAGTGYDQVTGLGSVDANALALAWGDLSTPTTTSISPSTTSIFEGGSVTLTATVTPSTATGVVNFYVNATTSPIGTATITGGTATLATTSLPVGTDSITGAYVGINGSSKSSATTVNVAAPFTMTAIPASITLSAGQSVPVTISILPVAGFTGSVTFNPASCSGMPAQVTCSFNQGSVSLNGSTASTVQMTVSTPANMAATSGSQSIIVTGVSGTASVPTTVGLTITATTESFTISPTSGSASFSVLAGVNVPISIIVTSTSGFVPNGSGITALPLSYTCTGLPSQSTGTFNPGGGGCGGSGSISATAVTLNIATTAPTAQVRPLLGHGSRLVYALLLPGMFGIVLAGGSRARSGRLLGLIVLLSFSTLWFSSCSGGSNSSQKNPGTPPGTYAIVVTATTGGANPLTNSFTVNLTVAQ